MREPLPAGELEAVSTTDDPLAEAIRRADLRALWVAIEELPQQQRDALLLREFGGLSYAELAAALAVSGPAVESLLFRARDGLRGKLRAVYGAITGASWIEAIIRVAVGGGAPVAAKVAVLGLGAAAVGSGAVVVPQVYDNHHPSHGPPPAAAVVAREPAPAAVLVSHVVTASVARVVTASVSRVRVHTSVAHRHASTEHDATHVVAQHESSHESGQGTDGHAAGHEGGQDSGSNDGHKGKAGKGEGDD